MQLTKSEEDYIKALFHLILEAGELKTGTNQLAEYLHLSPSSAHAMLKKLRNKELVSYEKYGKPTLTKLGKELAIELVRRHRLWETFLFKYLNFSWDEVHDVAEQLEHIKSPKLIEELDKFMGFPKRDPHGASIPNLKGELNTNQQLKLSSVQAGQQCKLLSINDRSDSFLRFASKIGMELYTSIYVQEIQDFDQSMVLKVKQKEITVTKFFADKVFVEPLKKPEVI